MNHKAIYALYPQVVTVDDGTGAFDAQGNKVEIDQAAVAAWVFDVIHHGAGGHVLIALSLISEVLKAHVHAVLIHRNALLKHVKSARDDVKL